MSASEPKPQLHFMHGNGFPAGTYRRFLSYLEPHYQIGVTEKVGHQPEYPVTDGWRHLVQELIDTLEASYQQPVILVGHSLGGLLSLMAARVRPDLIRSVVVIDSPVVAGWRAQLVRAMKQIPMMKRYSPAYYSEKRKHRWPDREAAYQHFASKPVFAAWQPEVLRDYVEFGTRQTEDGVELSFSREVETAIYLTLPHRLGRLLKHRPSLPLGFVGGTNSVECRQAGDFYTKKLMGKHYTLIQGSHLIPMEQPEQTAKAVLAMLKSFK